MRVNCAIMINVLGGGVKQDATGDELVAATMAPIELATKTKGAAIHWYGKAGGFKAKRNVSDAKPAPNTPTLGSGALTPSTARLSVAVVVSSATTALGTV